MRRRTIEWVDKASYYEKWTPIYAAAWRGHDNIVRALIRHRANLDLKTTEQQTALFAATEKGHKQIIRQLLEAGASQTDAWMGLSVYDAAEAGRQKSTLKMLRAYESQFVGR